MDGMLVEVEAPTRSSHAMQAQSVGAFVVTVEDPTLFAENGGRLDIAGVQYDYTAVDPTTNVISLATSVTVPVALYDPVSVVAGGIVAQDFNAIVDPGDGHNVTVNIPFALRSQFQVGPYNPPLPVKVSDDLTELIEVDGQQPGNMNITDELGNVIWSGTNGPIMPQSETWHATGIAYPQHGTNVLLTQTITVPTGYTSLAYFGRASITILSHAGATDFAQVSLHVGGDASLNFTETVHDGEQGQVSADLAGVQTGLTPGSTITVQVLGGGANFDWGTDASNSVTINILALFLR